MTFRSVFAGSLLLAALQAAVSTVEAAGRVGQLIEWTASVVERALSPNIAAIPDLRPNKGG